MGSAVSERQAHQRHRATRSGRCIAAAGFIAIMATLTTLAFVAGISAGLVVVLNLILGSAAAALLYSVVLEVRQGSARDRAELATRMAAQARARSQEHIKFATALGRQLQAARAENAQLGARTRELEARLSEAEIELAQVRDALWISEAAEKRARAALVAAEQAGHQGRHLRPA
ncbi:MAG TPA: hypothetical protein VJ782_10450 [Aeromicrobium sp.]|nr:hypothetical protein [Aeromicrobium sp.]